jgi:hypothetical protein
MAVAIYEAFYLGNRPDLDTNDINAVSENANSLNGTSFGTAGQPLFKDIVNLTLDDVSGDGVVNEDGLFHNPVSYNLGSGVVNSTLDSSQTFNATIIYDPSSGLPNANVILTVIQDDLGNVFIVPPVTAGATSLALTAGRIQTINLTGLLSSNFTGLNISRQNLNLLCFAAGTWIATPTGERRVEDLQIGDSVLTLDHGVQPLRWCASRQVKAEGKLAPVVFAPGVLGNPQALAVSPQHRILVRGWRAELLFGEAEILVPAITLVNGTTIRQQSGGDVAYHHLMFGRHEVVFANQVPCESLFVSSLSLSGLTPDAREEFAALFPDWAAVPVSYGQTARVCPTPQQSRLLS